MNIKPKALVLKTDGTNCDEETVHALNLAGADAKLIHVNQLRNKEVDLQQFVILALPGGFCYGDDVASGKILAIELSSFFTDALKTFTERKNTLTIGICNGFQVLVRTGLLPFNQLGTMSATLTNNASGRFECRWIRLKTEKGSRCEALRGIELPMLSYQVAHGEGKFFTQKETLEKLEKNNLIVFRYCDENGKPAKNYPDNPNGSLHEIAGICDPTGRIIGLMPHPERFVRPEQYPNWRREKIIKPHGLAFFEHLVDYVKKA